MLSCSSAMNTHLPSLNTSQALIRVVFSRVHSIKPPRSAHLGKGLASSSSTSNKTQERTDMSSVKTDVLTLLHKTIKVLPQVVETVQSNSSFARLGGTIQTWESILSNAHEDMSAAGERPAKIVVRGLDDWSRTTELVTALLADPLASAESNEALETRWQANNESKLNITPTSFQVSSAYLTQFPIPVEITEFRTSTSSEDTKLSQILQDPAIWVADIPILVCNPLATPLASILSTHLPVNTIIVLSTSIAPSDLDAILQNESHSAISSKLPEIISADPERALDAIRALQAEPASFSTIQRYQAGFVGSRLANITKALQSRLTLLVGVPTVRTNFAFNHISDALRFYLHTFEQVRHEGDKAFIDASQLKGNIEEIQNRIVKDVFGRRGAIAEKIVLNEVNEAAKQAEKEMRYIMDKLTWWRMIWRIDEVSGIIASALKQTWYHGLEKKLIMQTGRLVALQTNLTQSAFTLLAAHQTLSTAVLRNTLLQLKGSPHYHLTPESLTHPIVTRRNQMIEYPTMRLHAKAQQAVLGMSGGIVSGIGMGWAGWLGWMTSSGEGLFGFVGMEAGTTMGVGMLTALASIRWAIGSWEKSKKRWWQDWDRTVEGLDRDLKTSLCEVMRQQVVVVADSAATEVIKAVRAQEEHIANVRSKVAPLQKTLDNVASEMNHGL